MVNLSDSISRIKASDVPLARMEETELDSLIQLPAFDALDQEYRQSKAFRNVLANHSRLVDFHEGDLIVREGDWGSTAYFIVEGNVAVARGEGISDEILGRRSSQRKGLLAALLQRWTNHRNREYRDARVHQGIEGVGLRGQSKQTTIYLQDVPAVLDRCRTRIELGPGQLFGEIAALGRTARTATLIALSECKLLEVRWQGLRSLLRKDTGFRQLVEERFRENALRSFLLGLPIFQHLENDEAALEELLSQAQLDTYGEYDTAGSFKELATVGAAQDLASEPVIATEGDYPNGLVMIRSGLARVSRRHHHGHHTQSYLSPGQIFGYDEIAAGQSDGQPSLLKYSLRAIGFVSVVTIPTRWVEKYLLPRPPATENVTSRNENRPPPAKTPSTESNGLNHELLEFLGQQRLVNGTQSMIIDLDRCTRCDDCVRACASTHDNNPRFVRQGPTYGNVMIANACMHCQDPVCMIECPTGAISRREEQGQVTINDTTCIGCSTCSNNCPYDAIRMIEIRNDDGSFLRDTMTHLPILKATKCDLCVDQWGGPACQRACPHDALIRLDMSDVDRLAQWSNR